jgi:hypothetical protein
MTVAEDLLHQHLETLVGEQRDGRRCSPTMSCGSCRSRRLSATRHACRAAQKSCSSPPGSSEPLQWNAKGLCGDLPMLWPFGIKRAQISGGEASGQAVSLDCP